MSVLLSYKSFPFRVLKVLAFFHVFSFPMLRTLIYSEVLRTSIFFYRYRFASYRLRIFRKFSERTWRHRNGKSGPRPIRLKLYRMIDFGILNNVSIGCKKFYRLVWPLQAAKVGL